MSRPAAPAPGHASQPAPPGWPRDRSGLWLRNAAGGLCVLAAAAAAVSFTAQYRMVDATRHLPAIAALEAAIPRRRRAGLRLPRHRPGAARPPGAARETRVAARLRAVEGAYRMAIDRDTTYGPPEVTRTLRSSERQVGRQIDMEAEP